MTRSLREIYAGHTVSVRAEGDQWLVRFLRPDGSEVGASLHRELQDAVDAVHEWGLILGDEEIVDLTPDAAAEIARMLERRLQQMEAQAGEHTQSMDVPERTQLRDWFERQMEG